MKKTLFLITILSCTHLCTEVSAGQVGPLKVEAYKEYVLREVLFQEGIKTPLYGDYIVTDGVVSDETYGGTKDTSFYKIWGSNDNNRPIRVVRNPDKGIIIVTNVVDKDTNVELPIIYAEEKTHGDWYPVTNITDTLIIHIAAKTNAAVIGDITSEEKKSSDVTSEVEKYPKRELSSGYRKLDLPLYLGILDFILIIVLFIIYRNDGRHSKHDIQQIESKFNELSPALRSRPQTIERSSFLTERDVEEIVNKKLKQMRQSNPNPNPKPNPKPQPTPVPNPEPKMETYYNVQYLWSEGKLVVSDEADDGFIITRKNNLYTFTIKDTNDSSIVQMISFSSYAGSISVSGNTSSPSGVISITPGELRPDGDGRRFTIVKPVEVVLR